MNDGTTTVSRGAPSYDEPTSTWLELIDVVATPRRMAVLSTLTRAGEVTITDLTARVLSRVQDVPLADVTEEQYEGTMCALRHSHLPALVERGLIRVSGEAALTTVTPGPAFDAKHVDVVEELADEGVIDDAIASTLDDGRRRQLVSILAEREGSIGIDVLADALADRTIDQGAEELLVRLYHVDLPKLADAGLVEYDRENRLVSAGGLPAALEPSIVESR